MPYTFSSRSLTQILLGPILVYSSANSAQRLLPQDLESNQANLSAAAKTLDKSNSIQMLSYAIGYSTGIRLKAAKPKIDLDIKHVERGFKEHYNAKNKRLLSHVEVGKIMQDYQQQEATFISSPIAEYKKNRPKNEAAAKAFLQKNKLKAGTHVHAKGFQYQVLKQGTGKTPSITDIVHVHYRTYNTKGVEFTNSHQYGEPNIHAVYESDYKGWELALTSMPVGSKWLVYLPSELGYDDGFEPPHLMLGDLAIFELELLKAEPNPRAIHSP